MTAFYVRKLQSGQIVILNREEYCCLTPQEQTRYHKLDARSKQDAGRKARVIFFSVERS